MLRVHGGQHSPDAWPIAWVGAVVALTELSALYAITLWYASGEGSMTVYSVEPKEPKVVAARLREEAKLVVAEDWTANWLDGKVTPSTSWGQTTCTCPGSI
jgi:hypothetical protein